MTRKAKPQDDDFGPMIDEFKEWAVSNEHRFEDWDAAFIAWMRMNAVICNARQMVQRLNRATLAKLTLAAIDRYDEEIGHRQPKFAPEITRAKAKKARDSRQQQLDL
jgi:hypothetical protein